VTRSFAANSSAALPAASTKPASGARSNGCSGSGALDTCIPLSQLPSFALDHPHDLAIRSARELQLLQLWSHSREVQAQQFECSSSAELAAKNRFNNILTTKQHRVIIRQQEASAAAQQRGYIDASHYINACHFPPSALHVDGVSPAPSSSDSSSDSSNSVRPRSFRAQAYISTQAPLKSTFADFYTMLWEQQTQIVVMLTKCAEEGKKKADAYWPEASSPKLSVQAPLEAHTAAEAAEAAPAAAAGMRSLPSLHFGPFTVSLLRQHQEPELVVRELLLTRAADKSAAASAASSSWRVVHHIQYTGWPDFGVPDDAAAGVSKAGASAADAQQQYIRSGFARVVAVYRELRHRLRQTGSSSSSSSSHSSSDAASASASSAGSSAAAAAASSSPWPSVVVHCSAGVGRSGVWIAVHTLLDAIAAAVQQRDAAQAKAADGDAASAAIFAPEPAYVDLFSLAKSMRTCRQGMLQTEQQYAYVLHFVATCMRKRLFGVREWTDK